MGQTTDEIENRLARNRASLHAHCLELETRLRSALKRRHYYAKHTVAFMVAAVGLGASCCCA